LAAFFDLKERRIPNWLICIGLLLGILSSAFQGTDHVLRSIAGFLVGVGVLFVPFALGWIGAGDVKYFGVVGAILGVGLLPRMFFYSALAAGLITAGYLMIGAVQTKFRDQWADVKIAIISMGHILPEPVSIRTRGDRGSVPWGVAFAAGTILAYYVDRDGHFAGF
jgi:prepilin peptidase CpaA